MSARVKCLVCGAIIQSKSRHDFVSCQCDPDGETSIFVDGGNEYFRMGGSKDSKYEILKDQTT